MTLILTLLLMFTSAINIPADTPRGSRTSRVSTAPIIQPVMNIPADTPRGSRTPRCLGLCGL